MENAETQRVCADPVSQEMTAQFQVQLTLWTLSVPATATTEEPATEMYILQRHALEYTIRIGIFI